MSGGGANCPLLQFDNVLQMRQLSLLLVQVALAKASGKPGAAIDLLRRHVDVYMTDREAWEELAESYVQVGCRVHVVAMCWQHLGRSSDSSGGAAWRHCCRLHAVHLAGSSDRIAPAGGFSDACRRLLVVA